MSALIFSDVSASYVPLMGMARDGSYLISGVGFRGGVGMRFRGRWTTRAVWSRFPPGSKIASVIGGWGGLLGGFHTRMSSIWLVMRGRSGDWLFRNVCGRPGRAFPNGLRLSELHSDWWRRSAPSRGPVLSSTWSTALKSPRTISSSPVRVHCLTTLCM